MLLVGGYPYALKQRILGSKGHLFCRIDRDIIFFPECPKSLYMIRMFMCDKNRIYFPGFYDGAEPYVIPSCNKALSIAVDELYNSKVKIISEDKEN